MIPDYRLPLVAVVRQGVQCSTETMGGQRVCRLVYERPGPIRRFATDGSELQRGIIMGTPAEFVSFVRTNNRIWELMQTDLEMDIDL